MANVPNRMFFVLFGLLAGNTDCPLVVLKSDFLVCNRLRMIKMFHKQKKITVI